MDGTLQIAKCLVGGAGKGVPSDTEPGIQPIDLTSLHLRQGRPSRWMTDGRGLDSLRTAFII